VLENNLKHSLNDLQAQQMGVSGERSGILDADMAQEATRSPEYDQMQSGQAIAAQAMNMPKRSISLIDVLYGGNDNGGAVCDERVEGGLRLGFGNID